MFMIDQQQALGFLVSQTSYIEAEVYREQYPDIQYPQLVPVDTGAPEWAKSITFFSLNTVGQAQWLHHMAKDIPKADIERAKHERGIEMAGIGYGYTLEELGHAMLIPGTNLTAERGGAARRAYEEFIDARAFTGDTEKGWTGLANDPAVTAVTAALGAGGLATWASKTPDEVIADLNAGIMGVYTGTLTVEIADTVLVPVERITSISNRRLGDTNQTVAQFIQTNNAYTAITGNPLTVRAVRGLATAGAGGTARLVFYRRDPQVVRLHLPMPHRFLPVWQTGPLQFDVPGIFRFGGVEVRRPGAMRYVDGI